MKSDLRTDASTPPRRSRPWRRRPGCGVSGCTRQQPRSTPSGSRRPPPAVGRRGSSGRSSVADRITLTGLSVFGYHGVFDHEKRDGQEFLVDITLWLDLSAAAATDELTRTVHYGELAELAAGIVARPPRDLIEAVAGEIAGEVVRNYRVAEGEGTG